MANKFTVIGGAFAKSEVGVPVLDVSSVQFRQKLERVLRELVLGYLEVRLAQVNRGLSV